ncbi:MAG: glycosyltransferase family 4 protein [Geminicoccaceae bacterium]
MNIAMIGSRGITTNYGGIEKVLDALCPRLVDFGHTVHVYSSAGISVEAGRLRAIPVRSYGGKHFENITRSALATLQALGRYDILHFHAIGPGILSLLTAATRQRSVVTIHGVDWRRAKWGTAAKVCLQAAQLMMLSCASGITVVSRSLDGYYRDRHGIEPCFIPNGMDHKHHVPLGAFGRSLGLVEGGYLLFASRLVPEKGCHDLLQAFARLCTDKKLVIAGGAGEPAYIEELKRQADPSRVVVTGHRVGDELAELFSNAHLFLLPSYVEGMSNALLEALAYQLPVLASDIEENAEVIGQLGFYFRTGDVDDLARRLATLLDDDPAMQAMRSQLARVRHIDWDGVASCYHAFYHELLAEAGTRPHGGLSPIDLATT